MTASLQDLLPDPPPVAGAAKPAPQGGTRRMPPRRLRRGLGPFETILGIILLVVFVLFLMRLYNSSSTAMESTQLVSQARRIEAAIDAAYANSSGYDSHTLLPVLYASGRFSTRTMPDNSHMWSPYRTMVQVWGITTGTAYYIQYKILPLAGCTALLNSFTGQTSSKLIKVVVNGSTLADVPPTPSDVATACTQATDNNVELLF